MPTLIPRQVPLGEWALQVAVLMSGALLNNWAFAYNVPLTLQIVFRSSGTHFNACPPDLDAQLILERLARFHASGLFSTKEKIPTVSASEFLSMISVTSNSFDSLKLSVFLVSVGVILATTSRSSANVSHEDDDRSVYLTGILMLSISLLLTGILGILQEQTYKKYGPCWREGVFYTVRTYIIQIKYY